MIDGENELKMLFRAWRNQGFLVCFADFLKSSQDANLQERRECSFSVVSKLWLGFNSAEQCPYMCCLTRLNRMVNLFMLNVVFCNFAKLETSEQGRCTLARVGLGKSRKGQLLMLFVVCL